MTRKHGPRRLPQQRPPLEPNRPALYLIIALTVPLVVIATMLLWRVLK